MPVEERLPEVWRNDETAELVNYSQVIWRRRLDKSGTGGMESN